MQDINDNSKTVKNRRNPLKVKKSETPLRERIVDELVTLLKEKDIGQKIATNWEKYNGFRQEQLDRQRILLEELDEFMDPIYSKPQEWMSDLHMPTAYTICKTFHARMFSAIMDQDPSFQVKSRTEANVERAELVQEIMRYTVDSWANNNTGIANTMDEFIWEWCTTGRGILKMRWEKEYTRFVDIEEFDEPGPDKVVNGQMRPQIRKGERPVKKDELIFDGPMWDQVPDEELLIVGGEGDPDKADMVIQTLRMTTHKLHSLADRGIFNRKAVNKVIEGGNNRPTTDTTANKKSDRARRSGESSPDAQEMTDRYQILEAYIPVNLDKSGISSDIIVWVHKQTREILRATYLWRVMKTGLKPYAISEFHKRKGQTSAIGLVELTYTLAKEIDAMHNMKIDFGMISSVPFGFYRATSSLAKERLPVSPGNMIPVEDPNRDVNFPNLGNRTAFTTQEEAALFSVISRMTGISDLQLGVLGAQGAARTATGARAVVNESNANLNIFLRRLNRGFKKALKYTFHMLQDKMPDGMEFRLIGTDGNQYFRRVQSREELKGMFDFDIEPNSSNSNNQVRIDRANQIFQITQNPILLQLGISTASNVFEAAKNALKSFEIRDWSRYITPPANATRRFTPEEMANRALRGVDVPLDPSQDLQGFIALAQDLINNDDTLGQFSEEQAINLARTMQQAIQLSQAVQQAAAQQANIAQAQTNSQLGGQQTAPGAPATQVPVNQGQQTGEQ